MRSRPLPAVLAAAALAAGCCGLPLRGWACTAFSVATPEGRLVAKGFDWVTGDGWIVVNERGRRRTLLLPDGGPLDSWAARYSSLTLTTVGPGFPVSGMNEAGLAIEALVDLSASPERAPRRGTLSGLELVQYGLDRFATVAELAAFAETPSGRFSQLGVALHFFACDRSGECAVLERSGSKRVKVTRPLEVPALANEPYLEDLAASRPASGLAAWLGAGGSPRAGSSAARFRTVARALRSPAPPSGHAAALELLEKVVLRRRTQWQVVWSLERGTLLLRQREAGLGTLSLRLADLDSGCSGPPRVRELGRRADAGFAPWTAHDAARAEAAVLMQLGGASAGPGARQLAAAVARATRSSACPPAQ